MLIPKAQLTALNLNSKGNKATVRKRLAAVKKHGLPDAVQPLSKEELSKRHEQKRRETPLEYLLVIDFEATCDVTTTASSTRSSSVQNCAEIIEFPIVLVDLKASKIVAKTSWYVRPVEQPKLSAFCTKLTGITQEQVSAAKVFSSVLTSVEQWLTEHCTAFRPPIGQSTVQRMETSKGEMLDKEKDTTCPTASKYRIRNWCIVTDGRSDLENFLTNQLELSQLQFPDWALGPYIDSRAVFASFSKIGRVPLLQQLKYLGLQLHGKEHCGLDDAVNIARIMIEMKKRGCRMAVNRYIDKTESGPMYDRKPSSKNMRAARHGDRTF
ncbi:3'-5' exonuclease eri1 [Taphrina deformans PYCC 5710]|uniref:3'-5' exonuclease eri1 n=1 Tax=Taphrina deformans (strain PYCC 5710 / ATCC 11124 / CBS 356.35 / IMI 108563 / JCM 9778 / NBRC 8474) TaxID=1097556 RepID=R4X755_TAPDE|nr:3'-5' exonuclease eri1 [Taphrina deformans PYCC 5710]|eukprot:CCG81122.1 3'-5' exonuclease eri1 [Taphrina deformans PYCC 5710]